jgi:hypothetical protein
MEKKGVSKNNNIWEWLNDDKRNNKRQCMKPMMNNFENDTTIGNDVNEATA